MNWLPFFSLFAKMNLFCVNFKSQSVDSYYIWLETNLVSTIKGNKRKTGNSTFQVIWMSIFIYEFWMLSHFLLTVRWSSSQLCQNTNSSHQLDYCWFSRCLHSSMWNINIYIRSFLNVHWEWLGGWSFSSNIGTHSMEIKRISNVYARDNTQ